ncbi:hypothetical protein GCM10017673_55870 [Streptosporangium violaceochromogenes]|nr:hypothetical protein GCM10017673_55870 [Streptosporangium violaceochromogenes]
MAEARRLIAALGRFDDDGRSVACAAGVTVAEAVRRLEAVPADDADVEKIMEDRADPPHTEAVRPYIWRCRFVSPRASS